MFNINCIILEKGLQKYIFINNTNYYNINLDQNLKESKNVNIEVFLVSQVQKQAIDIIINNQEYSLNKTKENDILKINTKEEKFESFGIRGKGTPTLIKVKIGTEENSKNIAYVLKYEKDSKKNIISKYKKVNIKNNNEKRINLCYTYNFFLENYISYSKNENCLNLEEHKENDLIMYNPWNKYLKNKNNLFEKTDFYYLIISTDNENWINNLEFSFKEETIEINSEVAINDFMNVNHSQTNIIKSSEIENKYILIQFSPIINLKNSINSINDEFTILSQFDINNNNIQKGKLFSKQNRTYAFYDDPLIDSYLSININSEVKYEIKYSIISNTNNIKKDNINENYNIELSFENNIYSIKYNPLFKNIEVLYYIFIFFGNNIEFISPSFLHNLVRDENSDSKYIIKEIIKTNEKFIKKPLTTDISNKMKNENYVITILAEENDLYNIIMNYDVLKREFETKKNENNVTLIIAICLTVVVVVAIIVLSFLIYKYILKKKLKKDNLIVNNIELSKVILN